MFTISQADDGAVFSSPPPMAQQFLYTVHSLFFTVKIKIIKKQTLPPIPTGAGRQNTCRYFPQIPTSGGKESTDLWPWERECVSNMHLAVHSHFFPRRHFASALSRQGRLLFWLISVFLLFFQNKSLGRHNIKTHRKKSTAVSTMVHKPAADAPNEVRTNDMWVDIGPTSFSFSRTERKNRCRIFHMECGGGKTPWKIWRTAICEIKSA